MNTRIFVLSGAFFAAAAAACGGSDHQPAQDPTSASATPAVGDPTTSAVSQSANSDVRPVTSGTTPTSGSTQATGSTQAMPNGNTSPTPGTTDTYVPPSGGNGAQAPVATNPSGSDAARAPDNTKVNERDRHGTLTPMDQGNSGSETKITAAIRKGLMSDKSLSFTAKNVKIITVGNKVTLRGPVKSDQEKATIENVARQAAGVSEVDNQLEVKN